MPGSTRRSRSDSDSTLMVAQRSGSRQKVEPVPGSRRRLIRRLAARVLRGELALAAADADLAASDHHALLAEASLRREASVAACRRARRFLAEARAIRRQARALRVGS